MNWLDERHGDLDAFVAASRDSGRTRSAPVRVNDDAKGRAPMFPAVDRCARSAFFDDYNGIDAYGGRVVAAFPVLTANGEQKVLAAVARFHVSTVNLQ